MNETEIGNTMLWFLPQDQFYNYQYPNTTNKKPWDIVITAQDRPDPLRNAISKLKQYHSILFTTLHVVADRFFKNRNNREIMVQLGILPYRSSPAPNGRGELYSLVDFYYNRCIRSLYHPSPPLQKLIGEYEKQLGNGIRIGVHIRMGNGMSDWKDSHTFLSHSKVSKFLNKLKKLTSTIHKKYPSIPLKIFLSTDSTTIEKKMKKALKKDIITTNGLRAHVGGIYDAIFNDDSIQKAVLDQMLLGKCDFLFITMRSGFSRIGLHYTPEGTPYEYI